MAKDWTGSYRSVVGCLGASNHTEKEREVNDYYATEPAATEWLCQIEDLDKNIWECACGVINGNGVKLFGNAACRFNFTAHHLTDFVQMHMTRYKLRKRINHSNNGLAKVLIRHACGTP